MMSADKNIDYSRQNICRRNYCKHIIISDRINKPSGKSAADTYSYIICAKKCGVCGTSFVRRRNADSHCLKGRFKSAESVAGKQCGYNKRNIARHKGDEHERNKH